MRRLCDDKASLHSQAQRVANLEEQLKATSLAKAEASQVGQHTYNMFLILVLQPSFLLLFCCLNFFTVHSATTHTIAAHMQCGLCICCGHQILDQLPFVFGLRQAWQQWSNSVVALCMEFCMGAPKLLPILMKSLES